MESPILGSQNQLRSPNASDARIVNLYPEATPEGQTVARLTMPAGFSEIVDVNVGPIRGAFRARGRAFFVSGAGFYELHGDYSTEFYGNVTGSGPIVMADNGIQIFIACNPDGFIFDTEANTLAQITDPDFPGAATVAYIDGYFIFNEPDTGRVWATEILDGTSIDGLAFATAEGAPDNVEAVIVQSKEAWMFGSDTIEVFANAGLIDFPLAPIPRAFVEVGTPAPYSVVKVEQGIVFLSADERGQGCVKITQGYNAQNVSSPQIDWLIQSVSDLSDARAFAYQQDGHTFYVLNIPGLPYALVYDLELGAWHLRAGFENGQEVRYRPCCHMSFQGVPIVGDFETGKLYAMRMTEYTDAGLPRRWVRRWRALPPGTNDLEEQSHHELQLRIETGIGLEGLTPELVQLLAAETSVDLATESSVDIQLESTPAFAVDPVISLRWSDDGGHTWSNYHNAKLGPIGRTGTRVIWRRLGTTEKLRDRVYEVSSAAPVRISIMGAVLHNVSFAD